MEEIGIDLVFEEIRLRGQDKYYCVLRAIEEGHVGCTMEETVDASSWEQFKEQYPTLRDILFTLFPRDGWNPSWRKGDRILFIKSVRGHEGLYEFNKNNRIEVSWDEIQQPA